MGNALSAGLQSGTFMGQSGGLNSINSLDQTVTLVQNPENEPPNYNGNAPQSFSPLTAPQFYTDEQKGAYKFLNKQYNSSNTPTTSNSNNLMEYLLIGGAIIIIVIIVKKNNENS